MAQSSVDSDRLSSAGISTHSSGTAGTISGSVVGVRVGESGHKREDEDEYNLGPLPPMWEKAFTPSGEVYFIDHNSGTSHWLDPRLARVRKHSLGECGEDELPYGWERVTDERYGSYYVDHINRRTQYENPVLQARRLRAEKMGVENGSDGPPLNGEELRGDRFTVTLTKGTQGLGFTLIGAEGIPEVEGYLQIRSIVPNSPAWIDGGLQPGDVVVGVGGRAVRGLAHAQVAQIFQSITPGTEVVLHLVRGYPLSFDSADPNTRVLSTLAVEAADAVDAADSVAMQHLTMALRSRFNLESPGAERAGRGGWREAPPRCPSADHLLNLTEHSQREEPGQQLALALCRGAAGFGFTIADSVHGQKVKKVLDRSRCAGLREGDLLLQIGDTDVRHAPHQHVVQVLKECPLLQQTALVVWRRTRTPRSRSATRATHAHSQHAQDATTNGARSKTPTAEQLRSSAQESLRDRLNGTPVEATYAVPEHKGREGRPGREGRQGRDEREGREGRQGRDEREGRLVRAWQPWQEPETWVDNSNNIRNWAEHAQKWDNTNGQKWDEGNSRWEEGERWDGNGERWGDGNWGEVPTPTVHVDMNTAYWRGNASVADSSDNGGFPEDGMLPSPATAAVGALSHSPHNSTGVVGSPSPPGASASERLLRGSPSAHSPHSAHSAHSAHSVHSAHSLAGRPNTELRLSGASPARATPPEQRALDYPQVEAGGTTDPEADVMVRLARSDAGFGFRIVGGTEDGSRVAVGYVVPGGPAEGLLRAGDLLTSVEGAALAGESHARAVARVVAAAARGHVTLGVRHNRADVKHDSADPSPHELQPACYNILHPAPVYPPQPMPMYEPGWAGAYDVSVSRAGGEGFGFVVISSTNKATSTIGQVIPNSPAARCGLLHVGDTILAINRVPVRNLPHPEVVALIKRSGARVTLTVHPHHPHPHPHHYTH